MADGAFSFLSVKPRIDSSCYVAKSAEVIGDVQLASHASIWPMAVLRADINAIVIGTSSNVQDGTVIHVDNDYPTIVGEWVTVGHRCVIHGCRIGDFCLIGMGSILLDGVDVGEQSVVGANTLVTKGTKIPPGSLVLGSPGKVVRALSLDERHQLKSLAEKYCLLAEAHKQHFA
jgi:gamma-carbonic anhydrase